MEIMNLIDGSIDFFKERMDAAMESWNNLEEDKKKLVIGCVAVALTVVVVATIAYKIGKAHGQDQFFDEDDF